MGGWGGVSGWGLHSHFRVKPNRCVVLCWGWGFDNLSKNVDMTMPMLLLLFVVLLLIIICYLILNTSRPSLQRATKFSESFILTASLISNCS